MFGLFGSLLLSSGNSSVSVSKSANERSSNVLLIVMLAVPIVVTAVLLTMSLLILLLSIVVENEFSNFIEGMIALEFTCDVVVLGCEIVGDDDTEQTFVTLLINALDGNGEEEIVQDPFEVVNVTKFGCSPDTIFVDSDDSTS